MKKKQITNQVQDLPKKADIRRKIVEPERQLYRTAIDLAKFKLAVQAAEAPINPNRYQLYHVYKGNELDSHLCAAWQQRKNLTLGSKFYVYNPDGEVNEEKSKLIQTKWFREFLDLALDSILFGHSLIQFDSIIEMNGIEQFKSVDLIPRIYVKPELHIVTQDTSAIVGTDYLDKPWRDWVISVGKPFDLGLYLKASPLVIWKKNAMGAWAEFIEKFGTPTMIGKTNARDNPTRENMQTLLRNAKIGLTAVIDGDEEIQILEAKGQDAYQVFDMMIQRCNSELSKLILGQTSTIEDKAFVGSAEVHERVLEGYEDMDDQFITGVLNYDLVPLMNNLGFGLEGMTIACEEQDEWSLTDKSKFDLGLINSGKYKLEPEYIKQKYNTEVEEAEEVVDSSVQDFSNKMKLYYK